MIITAGRAGGRRVIFCGVKAWIDHSHKKTLGYTDTNERHTKTNQKTNYRRDLHISRCDTKKIPTVNCFSSCSCSSSSWASLPSAKFTQRYNENCCGCQWNRTVYCCYWVCWYRRWPITDSAQQVLLMMMSVMCWWLVNVRASLYMRIKQRSVTYGRLTSTDGVSVATSVPAEHPHHCHQRRRPATDTYRVTYRIHQCKRWWKVQLTFCQVIALCHTRHIDIVLIHYTCIYISVCS